MQDSHKSWRWYWCSEQREIERHWRAALSRNRLAAHRCSRFPGIFISCRKNVSTCESSDSTTPGGRFASSFLSCPVGLHLQSASGEARAGEPVAPWPIGSGIGAHHHDFGPRATMKSSTCYRGATSYPSKLSSSVQNTAERRGDLNALLEHLEDGGRVFPGGGELRERGRAHLQQRPN